MKIKTLYKDIGFHSLFTTSQPKLNKSVPFGYLSAGRSFAPADTSGANVCPYSTPECREFCLTYSGQGGIGLDSNRLNPAQRARINRTRLYYADPDRFWAVFNHEMHRHVKRSRKLGLTPDFRPNVYSDLLWERIDHPMSRLTGSVSMFHVWPMVEFHDYTKIPYRYRPNEALPPNYHLTMSLSESNDMECAVALQNGRNVAVVFRDGLPDTFAGYPVIDGDKHDLRFLDSAPCIVGLRVKGHKAKKAVSSFFRCKAEPWFRITPQTTLLQS